MSGLVPLYLLRRRRDYYFSKEYVLQPLKSKANRKHEINVLVAKPDDQHADLTEPPDIRHDS